MDQPSNNRLLAALSPPCLQETLTHCRPLDLPLRFVLQEQGRSSRYAYFLTSGIASVVCTLPEGGSQETALIGQEGMVGLYDLLGSAIPPTVSFMQLPGAGYRLPMTYLRKLFASSGELRGRVLEQVQQLAMTTGQIAACNNAHAAEARLARWLLMVQDRTGLETLALTQEFLSEMLGDRRTTVALSAGSLQHSGMIEYSRGRITILSRESLRSAACECYGVTERLLKGLYRSTAAPAEQG